MLVGGAPLNESFAEAVGADAYCRDASVAVETARRYWRAAGAGREQAGRDPRDIALSRREGRE